MDISQAEAGNNDSEDNGESMDDQDTDAEEYQVQATECRATSSQHDALSLSGLADKEALCQDFVS